MTQIACRFRLARESLYIANCCQNPISHKASSIKTARSDKKYNTRISRQISLMDLIPGIDSIPVSFISYFMVLLKDENLQYGSSYVSNNQSYWTLSAKFEASVYFKPFIEREVAPITLEIEGSWQRRNYGLYTALVIMCHYSGNCYQLWKC